MSDPAFRQAALNNLVYALGTLIPPLVLALTFACGHHHRPITMGWAGTVGSVAPSTAHQVTLDLVSDGGPATFSMEPPGLHLHLWSNGAGLVTHGVQIGDFEGPFPFVLDADYPGRTTTEEAA